jgi:hypothetical protein
MSKREPSCSGFIYDKNIIFETCIKYNNFGTGFSAKNRTSSAFPIDRFADKPAEDEPLMEYLRRPPPMPERRSMGKVFVSGLGGLDRQSAVHDDAFAVGVAGRIRHQIQDGSGHLARLGVTLQRNLLDPVVARLRL